MQSGGGDSFQEPMLKIAAVERLNPKADHCLVPYCFYLIEPDPGFLPNAYIVVF